MSKISNLIGQTLTHSDLTLIQIIDMKPGSRTIVVVKCLDRGPGWDETTKSYKGCKISTGWYRGDNAEYGKIEEVHINTLI